MRKLQLPEILFLVVILVLSLLNIISWNFFSASVHINLLSQLVSLAGIVGVVLYVFGKPFGNTLIYAWCLLQLLEVNRYVNGTVVPILDMSQVLHLSFGMQGGGEKDVVKIHFNWIAIAYLAMAYRIYLTGLKGTLLWLTPFRDEGVLSSYLPATAEIVRRVKVRKENTWLIVKLDKSDEHGPFYAALHPKDKNERFNPSKKQMIYLVIIEDRGVKDWSKIPEQAFGSGDWAYAEKAPKQPAAANA